MNVLMTADTVGGVFSYALELSRALASRGVAVALATRGAPLSREQRAEVEEVPGLDLYESTFRLEWMQDPWRDVEHATHWLISLAQWVRPDVVHLNDYAHGAAPFPAPRVVVGHSCVLSWFEAVRRSPAPPSFGRYRDALSHGLAGADAVVAPSGAMLRALRRHYGPLPRARVIPNGRDPARFGPAPKEPFVLAAGRLWDEAKNVAALDAVAARLPWPVYLAGDEASPDAGAGAAAFRRGSRPLGRLGPAELAGWYARAAIYALPARYEPFGLSVLEAALSGCALVLGDIESLRENWDGAALFAAPDDAGALEAAVLRLVRSPSLRTRLAARARRRALDLGPGPMADAYLAAYADAAARRQALRQETSPCAS